MLPCVGSLTPYVSYCTLAESTLRPLLVFKDENSLQKFGLHRIKGKENNMI
jgi:hypothetical protein